MDNTNTPEHPIERDRNSSHMDDAALTERIKGFIDKHNTGALATASGDFVRCTPVEYNYVDGCIYIFSEGGLKFRGLKRKLPEPMNLIKIIPESHDLLDSTLKDEGFGSRQHLETV